MENIKENIKLNTKTLSKISLIISKMGISSLVMELNIKTDNESNDKEMLVKKLISLVIDNVYKAENELTDLIAEMKGISREEAQEFDLLEVLKELLNNEKIQSFLK